ncbi:MAG: hypothetical protein L6Q98_12565 [Anaerolineae bacterium]|nr:hypothetical protein [Anaerolineae bacterium]NUQ04605.1 hypothetical protein [Anaerolineae bacterium]
MSPRFHTPRGFVRRLSVLLLLIFAITAPASVSAACPASFPVTVPAGDTARLIEVIGCANTNGAGTNDVINLTNSTYTLSAVHSSSAGLPTILSGGGALTINGNGATIARSSAGGTPQFRLFFNSGANLTLNQVRLTNGAVTSVGGGGAIYNAGGTLRLTGVSVDANSASFGAGIMNSSGTVILHESLLANNVATSYGGGVANSSATLHVINSTISGNSATGTSATHGGGAIDSFGTSVLSFYNSTITNNTAVAPNTHKSGIWMESGTTAGYFNTILADNNGANNCFFEFGTTWGYVANIDSGTSCGFTVGTYNNTNPLLAPLAYNGGPTQTHALLPGSPAINHGENGYAVEEDDTTPLTTDQRGAGFPRIIGSTVDIGAYESFCVGSPYNIGASDTTALIEAIHCANATAADDVINLAPASTYTLTTGNASFAGLPAITSGSGALTINGNGATIERSFAGGTPDFRIFYLNGGSNLALNRVRLTNGRSPGSSGGGIYNDGGALTLTESTVDANTASNGAGIFNAGGSTTILLSSTVSNNVATNYGGGVVNSSATLHVINSTISGNSATGTGSSGGGGAIDSFGASADLSIRNSTITNNTAVAPNAARSGVWYEDGGAYIDNNIISGNSGGNNCKIDGAGWSPFDSIEDGTTCGFNNNANPLLGPLANNGGPTLTHTLLPGSPAINKGYNDSSDDQFGAPLAFDQRGSGFPRILDGTVDLGAYESSCSFAFPVTIAASDVTGLINAVTCANLSPANDVINLTNSTYTLTASSAFEIGLPPIVTAATAGTLTINGDGATITRSSAGGTPDFKFFEVTTGANLTLNRVTLTNGRAQVGGAIFSDGTLTITNSTIRDSWALAGGAISQTGGATTILMNSLIASNQAERYGGAFDMSSGTMFIINSTISGNAVTGIDAGYGGGAMDLYNSPTVTIINSTITDNASVQAARSGIWLENGTLTIQNSIVAGNNGANNCNITGGTLVDNGNNIDNGTSCGFGAGSFPNTNPQLAALANNGGFTFTHALLPGSPAINAGSNALAVDHLGAALTTDQRGTGFPRINNTTVDIGAFESSTNSLDVTVSMQGRSNPKPHPSYVATIRVMIMPSGGGAAFYDQNYMTSQNGSLTIPNLPAGTYLFRFKGTHTLAWQSELTIPATGSVSLETGLLLEGDANNTNIVNISDFSILAGAFGSVLGGGTYDARADFNSDSAVTISDFSLLAANFGQTGAGGVTP